MEKYINRSTQKVVKEMTKAFPVVMITGPRQVGKKTMLKHIGEKFNYVSLDNLKIRDLALNNEIGKGIVLCMIDNIFPIDRNNYYVPISYI